MGYAKEKRKADKRARRIRNIAFIVLAGLLLGACLFSIIVPPRTWKYAFRLPKTGERKDGELRIHFIDVGQGDATVLELPDGKIALIDGAPESATTALMRYLNALDVDTIDYLILTHADADHCGALDEVLACKKVEKAYIPLASPTVNTQYAEFYTALTKEDGCDWEYAQNGIVLSGEEYLLQFAYPFSYDVQETLKDGKTFDEDTNGYSAVVWLEYNGVSTLFTGDLPIEKEDVLVNASSIGVLAMDLAETDILKVGHHGAETSTGEKLLSCFKDLKTAVISCGENDYGHPSSEVVKRLQGVGTGVYCTQDTGSVIVSIRKDTSTHAVRFLGK